MEPIPVVPQTTEKFASCVGDKIVEVPVPLITENIVDDVFGLPQERVQNRATCTGKCLLCVIILMTRLARLNVGFIKGLDK